LQIDGIRSMALFGGALREAIHGLKYAYMRALAVPLGQMLVDFWQENAFPADTLVPVPLHVRRVRERGYNQSRLLAQYVGRAVGLAVACDVLRRDRYTIAQVHLSAEERRRNVADAFSCMGGDLGDKRVVLIDDVCTTGSTLEACSIALKAAGVRSVWGVTLARAV
jgi:ComF family protein